MATFLLVVGWVIIVFFTGAYVGYKAYEEKLADEARELLERGLDEALEEIKKKGGEIEN